MGTLIPVPAGMLNVIRACSYAVGVIGEPPKVRMPVVPKDCPVQGAGCVIHAHTCHTHMHIHTHTYTYIHTRIHTHAYIHTYTHATQHNTQH